MTRPNPARDSYNAMMDRCYNPKNAKYDRYGGRGIQVCQRWKSGFDNFRADMGERAAGMTLDRINNDGDYEPSNCRWATRMEQTRNRECSVYVDIGGASVHLMEAVGGDRKAYLAAMSNIYKGVPWNTPKNKVARLTERQAGEVKWLIGNTDCEPIDIAAAYNMSTAMVRNIRLGLQWSSAQPVEAPRPPKAIRPNMVPYINAVVDWRTAEQVQAVVRPYSQGFLARLAKRGLVRHDAQTGMFKATNEALAALSNRGEHHD